MTATVKYFYVGNSKPISVPAPPGGWQVLPSEASNPLFNFGQDFFTKFQSLSSIELGKAVPYVSLKTLDVNSGEILEDLNLKYFHNPIDLSSIGNGSYRYPERPLMSLKEIELKTDQASGYLYYTLVTLKLKIHRPSELASTTFQSLMYPGFPLLLEYGWNSDVADSFINKKELIYFAVKTYALTMDTTGQADLTVEGMALNERFNNTIVGDNGTDISSVIGESGKSIKYNYEQLAEYSTYLSEMLQNTNKNSVNYKVLKSQAEKFISKEKEVRGGFQKLFTEKSRVFAGLPLKKVDKKKVKGLKTRTFHNTLETFCHDTLTAVTTLFPGVEDFRIIYGNFNANCGEMSGKSIADFPINVTKFIKELQNECSSGDFVINVERFINLLISKFVEDDEYYKSNLTDPKKKVFDKPDIVVNFRGYRQGSKGIVELSILDVNDGIPPTLSKTPDGVANPASVRASILDGLNIPILSYGHANSFVKNISLTQISDQYMKSVLISRMSETRTTSVRSTTVPSLQIESSKTEPLSLPLRGTAEVLGHVDWKPFRSFWLDAGFPTYIDGIYKIMAVTHKLSAEGFRTTIDFMHH